MWGITGRSGRFADRRNSERIIRLGLARIAIRGPLEHATLELAGELDFSDADTVQQYVQDFPHKFVSIDLTGLDFIDTAGARAVISICDDRTQKHGRRPAVIGASKSIERTLKLVDTYLMAPSIC